MPPRPSLPQPIAIPFTPFQIKDPGWWLLLNDLHIPFHDPTTIELAVQAARKHQAVGVLLNGDILDFHQLSRWDREPTAARYVVERQMGLEFFAYLRHRLPKARIVYKYGNHEERLALYFLRHAPELYELDVVQLPALMKLAEFGIEPVSDQRVVRMGPLNILHGHEYKPGIQAPVNPARGLFLRAKSVAACGHFHQTSEHHEPTVTGKPQGAWSVGCACDLHPRYMPLNKWNLGFALVHLDRGGYFSMTNLRVMDGKVV